MGGYVREMKHVPVPHGSWRVKPGAEHFYEIGMEGYPLERITDALREAGLELTRDFRVPENPWHHFFILRPAGS